MNLAIYFRAKRGAINVSIEIVALVIALVVLGSATTYFLVQKQLKDFKTSIVSSTSKKLSKKALINALLKDKVLTYLALSDGSVTAAKIKDGSITEDKLSKDVILELQEGLLYPKFEGDTITNLSVGGKSITTANIAVSAVTTLQLANGAITSIKIIDGAVDSSKIDDGTIKAVDLATNSVITARIEDGAVTETKIADGAVTTSKLANNSVTSAKILNGTITADDIASGVITTLTLADGSVTTAKLADGAVTSAKIADGSILTIDMADGTVTTAKVADSGITTIKLADGSTTTAKIADAAITNVKIADDAITAAKILDGTISTSDLADGAVTAIKLANDSVATAKIVDGAVTTAKIGDTAVSTAKLANLAVTNAKLGADAITTDKIQDATIVGGDLAADINIGTTGTITATSLSGNGAAVTNVNAAQLGGQSASYYLDTSGSSQIKTGSLNVSGGLTSSGGGFTVSGVANNVLLSTTGTITQTGGGQVTFNGNVDATNGLDVTGTATATAFSGSGASLTSLNADNLSSGTVPSARISGSYTGITGVGTITTGTWNGNAIGNAYIDDALTISGGTIENTPIGSVTPSTGAFTTGSFTTSVSTPTLTTALGDLTIDPAGNTVIKGSTADNTTAALNVQNSTPTSILYARNDGNVGIGTAAPAALLHLNGGSGITRLNLANTATGLTVSDGLGINVASDASGVDFWNYENGYIRFATNSTERLRIDASGNVGIGTTSPTGNLTVAQGTTGPGTVTTNATVTLTGAGTQFTNTFKVGDTITVSGETVRTIATIPSDTSLTVTVAFSTTASGLSYTLTGGTRMVVQGSGNVGIGTTAPGAKLQVQTSNNGLNIIGGFRNENGIESGGNAVGIGFLNEGGGNWWKAGIVHERTSSYGQGTMHFLLDNTVDNSTVTLSDAKMSITKDGNVGIGTTSPEGLLHVEQAASGHGLARFGTNGTIQVMLEDLDQADATGPYKYLQAANGKLYFGSITRSGGLPSVYSDQVVIDNSGNVGIGTTSPGAPLDILGSTNYTTLKIRGTTTSIPGLMFENVTTGRLGQVYATNSADLVFVTGVGGTVEPMRMLANGNVGIGTTGPGSPLHVKGSNGGQLLTVERNAADGGGAYIYLKNSLGDLGFIGKANNAGVPADNVLLLSGDGAGSHLAIKADGKVGIGTTGPTYTLDVAKSGATMQLYNTDNSGNTDFYLSGKTAAGAGKYFSQRFVGNDATNGALYFIPNSTTTSNSVLTMQSGGNVGIGTTTPDSKLQIAHNSTYSSSAAGLKISNATTPLKNLSIGYDSAIDASYLQSLHDGTGYKNLLLNPISGNVGIGTVTPGAYKLNVYQNTNADLNVLMQNATAGYGSYITNAANSYYVANVLSSPTQTWVSGMFGNSTFYVNDQTGGNLKSLSIEAGAPTNSLYIKSSGNVGIGTASPGGGTGSSVLSLANSSAAPTLLANTTHLYSSAGEGYWMDAAGNATLQSPHDKQTGEWIFYSKNVKTGRALRVEMEDLVRTVEELSGKDFSSESYKSKTPSDLRPKDGDEEIMSLLQNMQSTGLLTTEKFLVLDKFTIAENGNLVVKGDLKIEGKLKLSENSRGYNVKVEEGSKSIDVSFTKPRTNDNYAVSITPSWLTQVAVTSKTGNGFTVNFSKSVPAEAKFDWIIVD